MEFTEKDIIDEIGRTGVVPVFNHHDIAIVKAVVETSYKAGLRIFEFTNRGENAFDVFIELVAFTKKFPGFILGAGTILTVADCEKFIAAGAKFIVSPILKIEFADICKRQHVPWIPGTATLTEIVFAKDAGAELIKVFPGSVLGPKFISSVLPVVPGLKLMPTGGVETTEENLKAWFDAGVFCVGLGSQIFSSEIIVGKNWEELEVKIKGVLQIASRIKLLQKKAY